MSDVLEAMRAANRLLSQFIRENSQRPLQAQGATLELAPLMEALEQVGRALPGQPGVQAEFRASPEASEYMDNLKQMRDLLERLQPQLEERRDAIRARLAKIRAALEWAESFSRTRN